MEIIDKPWGKEEVIEINDRYMMKKLTMLKGHRCSLQYHNIKCETIYVLSGQLRIYSGSNQDELESRVFKGGEYITLPAGVIHRMEAVEDSVYLEASTPEMDDVVRLVDDYERAPQ
ncbi:cupin domain-containing protein [Sulfuriflexus mobilis]|uniref:cupin domain-containing protein n=1 Tax=Sulfuriflexus mobilis TaxID=1811807 RepID=UPI00155A0225|nr:cupin domain-containing protein [Sulfuriflexus mobilis]